MKHKITHDRAVTDYPHIVRLLQDQIRKKFWNEHSKDVATYKFRIAWPNVLPESWEQGFAEERAQKCLDAMTVNLEAWSDKKRNAYGDDVGGTVFREDIRQQPPIPVEDADDPFNPVVEEPKPKPVPVPPEVVEYVRAQYQKAEDAEQTIIGWIDEHDREWFNISSNEGSSLVLARDSDEAVEWFIREYGRRSEPKVKAYDKFPYWAMSQHGGAFQVTVFNQTMSSRNARPVVPQWAQLMLHPDDGGINWSCTPGDWDKVIEMNERMG